MHNYTGVGWQRTTFGCGTEADLWAGPDLSKSAIVHLLSQLTLYVSLISPTKIECLSLATRSSSQQTKIMSLISSESSHGEADRRKLSAVGENDCEIEITSSCSHHRQKAPDKTIVEKSTRSTFAIKHLKVKVATSVVSLKLKVLKNAKQSL